MTTKQVRVLGQNPFLLAPRTPGVLGRNDAASPDSRLLLAGDKPGPAGSAVTLPPVRKVFPRPPRKPSKDRVVLKQDSADRPRRTRVSLNVTAHASPRWTGARSPTEADELNQKLSGEREKAVRDRVERYLRSALPDQQLIFNYTKGTGTMAPGALDQNASIDVDSKAVGSTQTLEEAGKTGRDANDPAMRRVDLTIALASAIDTDQVTTVSDKQVMSGATKDWSIKIGMGLSIDELFGVGGFNFLLKNRMTGQQAEGWTHYSVAGVGAGLPIPTFDFGWNDFTTHQPVKFSNFHGRRFSIEGSGFNLLVVGYDWSMLTFWGLPGGYVYVDIGGFVLGGAGLDLGSAKFGAMYIRETSDTYTVKVVRDEHNYSTSRSSEVKQHRVLFDTSKATMSLGEETAIKDFIASVAKDYQRPGVYR